MEQRQTSPSSNDFFELFDEQHLAIEVRNSVLDISLELTMFLSLGKILNQFLTCDVFIWMEFGENLLFHSSNPRFRLQSEEHRDVVFRRIPHSIVKQTPADNIGIKLQIFPILETEIFDSVQQFLLLLNQHVFVEGIEHIGIFLERFVQDEVLNPPILNNLFFTTSDSVFIDFQDQFSIIGLCEKANGDDVSCLQLVDNTINGFFRERKSFMKRFRRFRSFRTKDFENFHSKSFVRITNGHGFPCRWRCSIKFSSDFKGHILGIEVTKVDNGTRITFC